MADYITLGTAPPEEPCAQVGRDGYYEQAMAESLRWIELLKYKFGKPPSGGRYAIKAFPHDFGTYYEVVIYYSDRASAEYAFKVESEMPGTWD